MATLSTPTALPEQWALPSWVNHGLLASATPAEKRFATFTLSPIDTQRLGLSAPHTAPDSPIQVSFNQPTAEQLFTCAQQMIKLKPPYERDRQALLQLVFKCWHGPKRNLAQVSQLRDCSLLYLAQQLFQWGLGGHSVSENGVDDLNGLVSGASDPIHQWRLATDLQTYDTNTWKQSILKALHANESPIEGILTTSESPLMAYGFFSDCTTPIESWGNSFSLPWSSLRNTFQAYGVQSENSASQWRLLQDFFDLYEAQSSGAESVFVSGGHIRPVSALILVEGITEEIILPTLAQQLGAPFPESGIVLKSMGGKNQALQLYQTQQEWLQGPVIILLDSDADNLAPTFQEIARPQDSLTLIQTGEIEDLYPDGLILQIIEEHYHPAVAVSVETLTTLRKQIRSADGAWLSQSQFLKKLWTTCHVADRPFDKTEFAWHIRQYCLEGNVLPAGLVALTEHLVARCQESPSTPVYSFVPPAL